MMEALCISFYFSIYEQTKIYFANVFDLTRSSLDNFVMIDFKRKLVNATTIIGVAFINLQAI